MDVNISRLYSTKPPVADESELEHVEATAAPPRMFSDQMTNIYFQEWAPLIPVIHRPAFLRLYEQFIANPEMIKEKPSVAQLNLVFCIAASSVGVCSNHSSRIQIINDNRLSPRRHKLVKKGGGQR